MSTRRIANIFKRKFFSSLDDGVVGEISGFREKEQGWFQGQFKDISRLGGNVIVMKMGN